MKSLSLATTLTIMVVIKCPYPDCQFTTDDLDTSIVASLWNIHALSHSQTSLNTTHSVDRTISAHSHQAKVSSTDIATKRHKVSGRTRKHDARNSPGDKTSCGCVQKYCRDTGHRSLQERIKPSNNNDPNSFWARHVKNVKRVQKCCIFVSVIGWSLLTYGIFSTHWYIMYDGLFVEGIFHCIRAFGCDPWQVNCQVFAVVSFITGLLSLLGLLFYVIIIKQGMQYMLYICGIGFITSGASSQAAVVLFLNKADGLTGYAPKVTAGGGLVLSITAVVFLVLGVPHYREKRKKIQGYIKMDAKQKLVVVIEKQDFSPSYDDSTSTIKTGIGTEETDSLKK